LREHGEEVAKKILVLGGVCDFDRFPELGDESEALLDVCVMVWVCVGGGRGIDTYRDRWDTV
jgi:hypothetical protein